MAATHTLPERQEVRIRGAQRFQGFMTPLPGRRDWPREQPSQAAMDWNLMWRRTVAHPAMQGPLRAIAVLILLLFAVLTMILLFAQFGVR